MAINSSDRYKLIFEEHHHAEEIRFRIIRALAWTYVVLGAAFVWLQDKAQPLSWTVPAVAALFTVLMWMADFRNRSGIEAARKAGAGIEKSEAAAVPPDERYFTEIHPDKEVWYWRRHGFIFDLFTVFAFVVFAVAAIWLFISNGKLPMSP